MNRACLRSSDLRLKVMLIFDLRIVFGKPIFGRPLVIEQTKSNVAYNTNFWIFQESGLYQDDDSLLMGFGGGENEDLFRYEKLKTSNCRVSRARPHYVSQDITKLPRTDHCSVSLLRTCLSLFACPSIRKLETTKYELPSFTSDWTTLIRWSATNKWCCVEILIVRNVILSWIWFATSSLHIWSPLRKHPSFFKWIDI